MVEYRSEHWRPVGSINSERSKGGIGGLGLPLSVKIGTSWHELFLMIATIVHW